MSTPSSFPEVTIEVLSPKWVEHTIEALSLSFLDEPMTRHLGIDQATLREFYRHFVESSAARGDSLLLLENGELACVMLNDAHADYESVDEYIPAPLKPLFAALTQLHQSETETRLRAEGKKIFHFFCGGTVPNARKKGYLNRLSLEGYRRAKAQGFDYVLVEATAVGTQHMCRKQGFELIHSRPNREHPAFRDMREERVDIVLLDLARFEAC